MKIWKIQRDYRLKGDGVHGAMLGIARLHNFTLAGWDRHEPLIQHTQDHYGTAFRVWIVWIRGAISKVNIVAALLKMRC